MNNAIVASTAELCELVGGSLHGDAAVQIHGVADLREAGPGQIGFIRDPQYAALAVHSKASAVLVQEQLELPQVQILVPDAHAAFAKVAMHFHPLPRAREHQIHPSAVVAEDAVLEAPVQVGPQVVVGAGARIGAGTVLQAGANIGAGVRMGAGCCVFPRVVVYPGVRMGDRCVLHAGAVLGSDGFGYVIEKSGVRNKFPQLGSLELGDDVEVGANSTLDRGALTANKIGSGTKIDNLCHIGHNCSIGENSTVSALSAFAAGTRIGDRVILAGHVISGGNLEVGDDVVVGGNSVLTSDVPGPGQFLGYPLQPRKQAARNIVLQGRLDRLQEEVRAIRRQLGED